MGSWIIRSCIMNYYNPKKKKKQLFKRTKISETIFRRCALRSETIFGKWKPFIKNSKNAFPFTSKTPFVLKIFKFCLDFLVMQQDGLKKLWLENSGATFEFLLSWFCYCIILLYHHIFDWYIFSVNDIQIQC